MYDENIKPNEVKLPLDIWVEIVYFLDCQSIFNFSITCKNFSVIVRKSFNELNFSARQLITCIQRLDKYLYLVKEKLLRHDYEQLSSNINNIYETFKNKGLSKAKIPNMLNFNLNLPLGIDLTIKPSRPIFLDPLFYGSMLVGLGYSLFKRKQILLIFTCISTIIYRHHFSIKDEDEIRQLLSAPTSTAIMLEEQYIDKYIRDIETDETLKIAAFRNRFFTKLRKRLANQPDVSELSSEIIARSL